MVETIGIRIQYLREKVYNLSQEEFARKLGVSQRTISGMESDDVSAKNILKLESMGISRAWLETGTGSWNDINPENFYKQKGEDAVVDFLMQQLREKDKQIENLTTLLFGKQKPTQTSGFSS